VNAGPLKIRILLLFMAVLIVLSASLATAGYYLLKKDVPNNTLLIFPAIIIVTMGLATGLSFILSWRISKSLTNVINAMKKLADGEPGYVIATQSGIRELNKFAVSFNEISEQLAEREKNLRLSNDMLADLNRRYFDLIGFVSHELKGIVGAVIMNVYAVRDGLLGEINEKQEKALEGAKKSLNDLTASVRKYHNLSKIEKGELNTRKKTVAIKKDVFNIVADSLSALAARKNIKIINEVDAELQVMADLELLQAAANNLMTNAIKYGGDNGITKVSSRESKGQIEVEIYNDSAPINEKQKEKLFQRFSRLDNPATQNVKGAGLGLFVTKQIIERHGGKIWIEPKEKGNSFIFQLPMQRIHSKENNYV